MTEYNIVISTMVIFDLLYIYLLSYFTNQLKSYRYIYQIYNTLNESALIEVEWIDSGNIKQYNYTKIKIKDLENKEHIYKLKHRNKIKDKIKNKNIRVYCIKECLKYIDYDCTYECTLTIIDFVKQNFNQKINFNIAKHIEPIIAVEDLPYYSHIKPQKIFVLLAIFGIAGLILLIFNLKVIY